MNPARLPDFTLPENCHPDMWVPSPFVKTPIEIRADLYRNGQTLSGLCRKLGIKYSTAMALLCGTVKGESGKAHEAAVKLGLKEAT